MMEATLQQLGLNAKETKFYLFLLKEGSQTAAQLSQELGETRTNTYMVLNRLAEQALVRVDEPAGQIKRYAAAEPAKLKELLAAQQQKLRQSQASLSAALPRLTSIYNLGAHRPGVVYLEGLQGYRTFLEDIHKTGETVRLLGGNVRPQTPEAGELLDAAIMRRRDKGQLTQALFHTLSRTRQHIESFATRGFEVRFWGEPLDSEIVLYGNKVSFTIYQPKLIVTVITNDVLSQTFRIIFEQLWADSSMTCEEIDP